MAKSLSGVRWPEVRVPIKRKPRRWYVEDSREKGILQPKLRAPDEQEEDAMVFAYHREKPVRGLSAKARDILHKHQLIEADDILTYSGRRYARLVHITKRGYMLAEAEAREETEGK